MESGGSSMMMMMMMMMIMPDEIIVDILSRLEVKSVLRCRCVCKSWNMITQQKFFIEKHQKNKKNKCSQIIVQYAHVLRSNFGERYMFLNSCNGLVLELKTQSIDLKAQSNEYRIRNPITKQVVQIEEDKSVIFRRWKAILGFDSSTGNYKMINLCRNKEKKTDLGVIMVTIGSDGLSYESLDITLSCERSEPFMISDNDVCYALSFRFEKMEKSDLIRFTLDGKSSMNIKLPQGFRTGFLPVIEIGYVDRLRMFIVDDDKLAIGFYYLQQLHVWVLEDYNKHIWSHKIIITLDIPNLWKITVLTSPNIGLLRFIMGKDLLEYDVHSKKYTCLAKALLPRPAWYPLIPCLVSLKGMRSQYYDI